MDKKTTTRRVSGQIEGGIKGGYVGVVPKLPRSEQKNVEKRMEYVRSFKKKR